MADTKLYHCKVEASDTGMVTAQVFAPDGRRVGLKFFSGWDFFGVSPSKLEKRMITAGCWAREYAEICRRGEGVSHG